MEKNSNTLATGHSVCGELGDTYKSEGEREREKAIVRNEINLAIYNNNQMLRHVSAPAPIDIQV